MSEIPSAWKVAAERVLDERLRRLLVLGATDVGKSTFCRFLVGALVAAGRRAAYLDASVGQKAVGPPASVTLAHFEGRAEFRDVAAEGFYFVGQTSPVGRFLPILVGLQRLAAGARADALVVDTTGFVSGAGRVLKTYKIEALRPDLVIALARGDELEPILRSERAYPLLRLAPSPKARVKEPGEKDRAREAAFAHYFRSAQRVERGIDDIAFQRTLLFSGTPVALAGAVYAETTPEGLVAVAEKPPRGDKLAERLAPGFERGLLVGLADERGEGLGLGIVERIDFTARSLALLTPVAPERIAAVALGDLYLDRLGRELGRAPWAVA